MRKIENTQKTSLGPNGRKGRKFQATTLVFKGSIMPKSSHERKKWHHLRKLQFQWIKANTTGGFAFGEQSGFYFEHESEGMHFFLTWAT